MTIMSKDSQQPPARKPDPLAQYPERYSHYDDESEGDDQVYRKLQSLGVHEDYIDEMTPEQRRARLASGRVEDSGLEKPVRSRKPFRSGTPDKYDEASQTEPPEPAVAAKPAAASPPHFEQPPKWYDYPEKAAAAVEKVKSLTGGYLTSEEEDGVQSSIRLGQHPYQIAAALQKHRQATQQQAVSQRPAPAFPTVGRPMMPQTRATALGSISNAIIRQRNAGVPHQFESSIGGNAANYR